MDQVRYVTELIVKGGRVEFTLPDFVTNAAALIFDRLTQTDVDTVSLNLLDSLQSSSRYIASHGFSFENETSFHWKSFSFVRQHAANKHFVH